MVLYDWLNTVMSLAGECCGVGGENDCCQASAFTAIAAAFSTQGYWVQADIMEAMTYDHSQALAVLVYMFGAIGGLISMALGMPPKNYLWFFMGPGVFHWLLGTPIETKGVRWTVGEQPQDQSEVWKLSEAGLVNMPRVKNEGIEIYRYKEPSSKVVVAMPFVWLDSIVSDTFNSMIGYFGFYERKDNARDDSNILIPGDSVRGSGNASAWHLLSKLKWGYIENITAAQLGSGDLRDAFVNFLSNECGDEFTSYIDEPSFIAATKSNGRTLPWSVFRGAAKATTDLEAYGNLQKALRGIYVPTPSSLKTLLNKSGDGSLSTAFQWEMTPGGEKKPLDSKAVRDEFADGIPCDVYLQILISGFRWEAGHTYNQIVQSLPYVYVNENGVSRKEALKPSDLVNTLFYGWDIKMWDAVNFGHGNIQLPIFKPTKASELENFLKDLILVHLVRNELRIAPPLKKEMRFTSVQDIERASQAGLATSNAKSKYGELYTWALMTPYLQGVMLYILAIGYPFACILLLVPGWHKAIITWLSFWAWVKMWDVGFAVVLVLEQSIWSILGNTGNAAHFWAWITYMQKWGSVAVNCGGAVCGSNDIPNVYVGATNDATSGPLNFFTSMRIFDRAILVGTASDLDLQNGYYIYIMAALYMAVPAVCGQLVLGARAGAAAMVNNMIGGVAQSGGQSGMGGWKGKMDNALGMNAATQGQASYGKHMRDKNGLGAAAMNASNSQLAEGLNASGFRQQGSLIGQERGMYDLGKSNRDSNLSTAVSMGRIVGSGVSGAAVLALGGAVAANSGSNSTTPGRRGAPSSAGAPGGIAGGNDDVGGPAGAGAGFGFGGPSGQQQGGIAGAAPGMLATYADGAGAYRSNQLARAYNAKSAQFSQAQANAGISEFGASAAQSGWGVMASRREQQADFHASQGKWGDQAATAMSNSVLAGGMGLNTAALNPGQKPQGVMGMGMEGMLNTRNKDGSSKDNVSAAGFWASPTSGGYGTAASGMSTSFNQGYGGNKLEGKFMAAGGGAQFTPGSEFSAGASGFNNSIKGAFNTWEKTHNVPKSLASFASATDPGVAAGSPTSTTLSPAKAPPVAPSKK